MTFALVYAWSENYVLPHQPRRGRARQGLAAAQDAGRPVAAAGQPARLPRLHVGPPGQAAAVHGRRARPGVGVGRVPGAGLVAARPPRAPGRAVAGARPQPAPTRSSPALWSRDDEPGGFQWIDANDAGRNVFSFIRRGHAGLASPEVVVRRRTSPPCRTRATGSGCRPPASGTRSSTPTPRATPAPASATSAASRPSTGDHVGQPAYADIVVPPLATVWFRARAA